MDAAVKLTMFLRRHWFWVIFFPGLGLLGGYTNNLAKGPIYSAEMMIRSRVLTVEELTFLIKNYQNAAYPGLSLEERGHIRSCESKGMKVPPYSFITMTCETDDSTVFRKVALAMTEHIETEPYVDATTKNINDLNTALINQYSATIDKAETLLGQSDPNPALSYKNFRNIPDLTLLYEKRLELQVARRDSAAVSIVSGFKPRMLGQTKAKSLAIGLCMGIMASALFLFILHFTEYYRKTAPAKP